MRLRPCRPLEILPPREQIIFISVGPDFLVWFERFVDQIPAIVAFQVETIQASNAIGAYEAQLVRQVPIDHRSDTQFFQTRLQFEF